MVTGHGEGEFIVGFHMSLGDGFLSIMADGFTFLSMVGSGCHPFVMPSSGIQEQWDGMLGLHIFRGFHWHRVKFIMAMAPMDLTV